MKEMSTAVETYVRMCLIINLSQRVRETCDAWNHSKSDPPSTKLICATCKNGCAESATSMLKSRGNNSGKIISYGFNIEERRCQEYPIMQNVFAVRLISTRLDRLNCTGVFRAAQRSGDRVIG